ncbi:MAG: Ig-like domain repeat protein [Acidobacteriota bacterium]|nr:Ig-like domain repeat protein [Acidobacteriota bacterium]
MSAHASPAAPVQRHFGEIPLSFEPNRGQTDARIQFLSHGQGYALYLAPGEAVLELQKPVAAPAQGKLYHELRPGSSTLTMRLVDGNHDATATTQDRLPGTVNYFIGNESSKWQTGVETFKRIAYTGVYPGIDLVYYGNQRELEYDFIVAPHADPSSIALQFSGATPQIDAAGDLVLSLGGSETRFHKPVVYQVDGDRKVSIASRYLLAENQVRFGLGAYDHTKPLIIDPVLSYLTYLGGSSNDVLNGIAVDASGSVYVVGTAQSADFPTKNPYQSLSPGISAGSGQTSIVVSKFNATGTALVYSTYLGSTGSTEGFGIAVDGSGNAYVVGDTTYGTYPVTAGAFQTICGGNNTIPQGSSQAVRANGCVGAGQGDTGGVLTKLNATGSALTYSTYLSGNNYNSVRAVAVNAAGEAYVAGVTNSQCNFGIYGPNGTGYQAYDCYPTTSGAVQAGVNVSTGGGTRNFTFFSKLDAAGASLLYSTLLGPTNFSVQSTTAPLAIAVDSAGLAYVSGYSSNNLYTSAGSYQTAAGPANNQYGFVAKFDPAAQRLIYSTYVSGPKGSMPYVAADAAGNAYLAGNTTDCGYPTTAGAYQTQASFPAGTATNCGAGFVSKLNPTGTTLIWSTFLGDDSVNAEPTSLDAIALGSDGSIYVAGNASGGGYPSVSPVVPLAQYYQYPVITRLNATGTALLFSTTLSGTVSSSDNATGIAVDSNSNIYIAGTTNSFTLPVTSGAFQSANKTPNGHVSTGFVAKIAPTITSTTTLTLPTGTVTAGQSATFTAKVAGPTGTTAIPTGTVSFLSGTTSLGTGTLDATGTASYTATSLNATTYTVTASYAGDSNFSLSVSAPQSLVVSTATATVALTAPATAAPGASVTLSVRVTGSNGTPTGSVTFKDGTTTLSTVALASGTASYTTTALATGSHSLTASFTGDSIYGAVTSSTQTLVVALVTPTVTLTAPGTALVGASVALSASVAGTPGTPTGSVTFKDGTTVLATATLASGTASYTTTALTAGAHSITASYSGDTTFSAVTSAASTVTITVPPAITFTASPASLTVTRGMSVTTVITGTPVGGYTGTVTFSCGTLPAGASCVFAPSTLSFSGNNVAASTTLTFGTTTTTLGGVFAALLVVPFLCGRKRLMASGRLLVWTLLAAGSASLLGLGGCSAGSKGATTVTTAPGVYVVPVTMTAGASVFTVNLSVTVQ